MGVRTGRRPLVWVGIEAGLDLKIFLTRRLSPRHRDRTARSTGTPARLGGGSGSRGDAPDEPKGRDPEASAASAALPRPGGPP